MIESKTTEVSAEGQSRTADTFSHQGWLMGTCAIPADSAIAVVAEHAQPWRETLFLQPAEEGVSAGPAAWHAWPFAVDVIQREKVQLAFAAACAGDCTRTVVR
jgi:hypothetical protein